MRSVVQRVKHASVQVEGVIIGQIAHGLLVYLGLGPGDEQTDIQWMADKLVGLRIFADAEDKMNLSVKDVGGEILLVSQFTLYGDCRKGMRPSFSAAAPPQEAKELFEEMAAAVRERGLRVATGRFQADMQVEAINDGPVTLLLDSKKIF